MILFKETVLSQEGVVIIILNNNINSDHLLYDLSVWDYSFLRIKIWLRSIE